MNTLYIIQSAFGKDTKLYAGGQAVNRNIIRCSLCRTSIEPFESKLTTIIELDHLGRNGFSPFLWAPLRYIVREDIAIKLQNCGLTGFSFGHVTISKWSNSSEKSLPVNMPNYLRLIPTSNITLLEPQKEEKKCPYCGFQEYKFNKIDTRLPKGIQIDYDSWNGSDIAAVDRYSFVFCSEKFVRIGIDLGLAEYTPFVKPELYCTWERFSVQKWEPKEYHKYERQFLIMNLNDLEKFL